MDALQVYQSDDGAIQVNVQLHHDTAWLSLDQMTQLFSRDKSVISRHVRNVFKDGELNRKQLLQKMQQLLPMVKLTRLSTSTSMLLFR